MPTFVGRCKCVCLPCHVSSPKLASWRDANCWSKLTISRCLSTITRGVESPYTRTLLLPRHRYSFTFFSRYKSLHIFKIGRKHKSHRQQLEQSKPWRNSEKGRKGDKNKGKGKGRRNRMGQEESRMVDDKTPPETLESRSVEAIAKYIKDGKVKRIVVMVSAIVTAI